MLLRQPIIMAFPERYFTSGLIVLIMARFISWKISLRPPKNTRKAETTFLEECRIKKLGEKHIHYGKRKPAVKYFKKYGEKISSHKVQYVINKWDLYPDIKEHKKLKRKLRNQIKKTEYRNSR